MSQLPGMLFAEALKTWLELKGIQAKVDKDPTGFGSLDGTGPIVVDATACKIWIWPQNRQYEISSYVSSSRGGIIRGSWKEWPSISDPEFDPDSAFSKMFGEALTKLRNKRQQLALVINILDRTQS